MRNPGSSSRRLPKFLTAVLLLIYATPAGSEEGPRVLILNSYHPQYEWTVLLVRGMRHELKDVVATEDLHIEFMDSRRMLDRPGYSEVLAELFQFKYGSSQPHVILATDDNALGFLQSWRSELFPGVPVVFCGVNAVDPDRFQDLPGFTGVLEGLDVESNLRLIRTVHPEAREVIVLSDVTSLGRNMTDIALPVLRRFQSEGLGYELWDDFTLASLYERLAALEPDRVVLLLAIHQDKAGRYFSFDQDLPELTRRSAVPVYALFGMLLGKGILGGAQNDPYEHGRHAAQIARRVLDGESVDDIDVRVERYRPRFDHRVLRRFNIAMSRLPAGSEILHRPVHIWEQYPRQLAAAGAAFSLLVVLVVSLGVSLRKQRRAERILLQSEARLRELDKMETVGRLAGGVAHDFNNLLTPILGYAELAKRVTTDRGKLISYLDSIAAAARRARDLVVQLLAFSRREEVPTVAVDLNATVEHLMELLRRTVREDVTLGCDLEPRLPAAMADSAQVERVIMNLVINAAQAIKGPGHVLISTLPVDLAASDAGRLDLSPGSYLILRVEDDGGGMDTETLKHIFEPFFSIREDGQGTGLGLASVYGIVKQHGGTIDVKSRPDEGSRFDIYFRAGPSNADGEFVAPDERPAASTQTGRPNGPVLVVEDENSVRELVEEALRSSHREVVALESPEAALVWLESHGGPIGLLVTDVVMPEMDGVELWKRIREKHPETPAIFMTGYSARVPLTVDAPVLRKPFGMADLREAMCQALELSAPSGGA